MGYIYAGKPDKLVPPVKEDTVKKDKETLYKELSESLAAVGGVAVTRPELTDVEYERMEYDAPSDEELASQAEAALTEYASGGKQAIEIEADEKTKKAEADIEKTKEAAEKSTQIISEEYEKSARAVENDAIKRGLARSSIAMNNAQAVYEAQAKELSDARTAAQKNVSALETEIKQLEVSRQAALDNFNITYAAKLTEKINELSDARDKKSEEVLKYNNQITEKETAAAREKEQLESQLYTDALTQAAKARDLNDQSSASANSTRYNLVADYLSTLSHAEAKEAVKSDPLIRNNLNDYYYFVLYKKYIMGKGE